MVRDGVLEPAGADRAAEIVDWRERAVDEEPVVPERRAVEDRAEPRSGSRGRLVVAGAAVTVGLVALVAVWYSASGSDEVTAHCVNQDNVLADDEVACDEEYVRGHGGYYSGGTYFFPLANGRGVVQYHYNYGGTIGPDRRVSGGSATAPPSGTTVKTQSGKPVQRGGFGSTGGSKSVGS